MESYPYIVYGERGIGKSTLADIFFGGNALFCMFENDRTLDVYRKNIAKWGTFLDVGDEYCTTDNRFSGLIVDNGAVAYELAMQYACEKYGFEHPGQVKDYGGSWSKVKKEFKEPFQKLFSHKKGFMIICHELREQIEDDTGFTFYKVRPDWSGQADSYLSAFCENIFYYHFHGSERYLQIIGDSYVTAKTKFKKNFFTPSSQRIVRIPMGNSLDEGYKNLLCAWNNQQQLTFKKLRKEEKAEPGVEQTETERKVLSLPKKVKVMRKKISR